MHLVIIGGPIAVLACVLSWVQRRSWQRPPATPQAAAVRDAWEHAMPYGQLGVRAGPDGFVYACATGRPLGPMAGARAVLVPARPVTTARPATGWAVIYFADGSMHRQPFATRNRAEATTQAERFNGHSEQAAPAMFRRARPAPHPAARP
jgi:hypothetical protein